MLYSELQERTDQLCTYNEYEVINAAYMEAAGTPAEMDKDDAANLWWQLYGVKWEAKKEHHRQVIKALVDGVSGNSEVFKEHYDDIDEVIEEVKTYFKVEILPFTVQKTNRFTDNHNVTWSVRRLITTGRWDAQEYSLSIIVKGKKLHVTNFHYN